MTDLDALLDGQPITPPSLTGSGGLRKKCRRHAWVNDFDGYAVIGHHCAICGIVRDERRAKMGKSVLMRSKREERGLAKSYGGKRTGHFGGPDDVQTGLLNIQSKAGTGWWSVRYALELDKLPRTGGRVPALIVSNGQPGSLVRRFVVMDERDYRSLYGDRILDGDLP